MTAKSDSDTDFSGAGATGGVSGANVGATGAGANTGLAQDSASSYQRDVSKDTGTDERYQVETADRSSMTWLNAKRTYDWHQTLDADALLDKRKHQAKLDSMEIAEREQRLAHQGKLNSMEIHEREQSRRHYEDMHSLRYFASFGFAADTLQEAFADRVAERVCERLGAQK